MRAIVGVEALHDKGEGRQQPLQDRQWVALANALHAPRELVLRDLVDAVAVKGPFVFVEVALVRRRHPVPALAAIRTRLAVRAGLRSRGARDGASAEHPHVGPGTAQVVQMTVQGPRLVLATGVPEDRKSL